MFFKISTIFLVSLLGWIIYHDRLEYVSPLPVLDEKVKNVLASLKTPPHSVIDDVPNYGLYNRPIKDVNLHKSSPIEYFNSEIFNNLRLKRWQFHGISTSKWIMSFHIVNAGYVAQASCYFYDKETGMKYQYAEESLLGMALKEFSVSSNGNRVIWWVSGLNNMRLEYDYPEKSFDVSLDLIASGKRIYGIFKLNKMDVAADEIALVFPHSKLETAYTHKVSPMGLLGFLNFGDKRLNISDAIACSDFTSSYEKRQTTWTWASMSGRTREGKVILINLTSQERFLEYENAIWIENKMQMVGQVKFIQPDGNDTNWRIKSTNGKVDLTFIPLNTQSINIYFVLVHTKYLQSFGTYSGTFEADDGVVYHLEGLLGVAENHYAKW